ncbi:MAG: shikimate dehydrogenase [Anaerolineae bacterium]
MSWPIRKVGVVGWPVEHSISPAMHNAAFAALGMTDWLYDRMAIPPDILRLSLREFVDHGYVGVNITVPHKEAALALTRPDELAKAVGAVNTIDFRTRTGTNTDVIGFISDLQSNDVPLKNEQVLLLGAGGAARAAAYGLVRAGARLAIANRTPERAERLKADLGIDAAILKLDELTQFVPSLIVNCTTVGMYPHIDQSPWPDDIPFPSDVTAYDMVYRPRRTRFLEQAEAAGARAIGGLGMLVRQGAASFRIWTGVEPPVDVMTRAAEAALGE